MALPSKGVASVVLPRGAPPDTLVNALRFLLTGQGEAPAPGDGPGFSFVEAAFGVDAVPEAFAARGVRESAGFSLFRGVDRRGTTQVSLREDGGRRVFSGEADVAVRVGELFGVGVDEWCARALDPPVPAGSAGAARAQVTSSEVPGDAGHAGTGDETARAARRAVQELRRSLRAERLRLLASRRHSELLDHGRRLRCERARVARESDLETVERDRVRTRLRRVNEYRDQLARGVLHEDVPPGDRTHAVAHVNATPHLRGRLKGPAAVEFALISCAAVTFMALVLYSTGAGGDPDQRVIQIGLGLGFIVSVVSFLHVAARPTVAEPTSTGASAPATEASARRDSLRRRFADLGDPDDPQLPNELRVRLSELDGRLSPLLLRLERLDDAITVLDVEAGRAARALHEALPELEAGDVGLPEGSDVASAVATVHELGDAVYAAVVERDALLAEGSVPPADARQALGAALDALADRIGAPGAVAAVLRRVDSFACAVGERAEEDELADVLDREIAAIESVPTVAAPAAHGDSAEPAAAPQLVVLSVPADEMDVDALTARWGGDLQIVVGVPKSDGGSGERMRRPGASRRPR